MIGSKGAASSRSSGRSSVHWGSALALAIVLLVAAWARVVGFEAALAGGELLPLDGDSHYHLRRIEAALRGAIPTFDPLMNWPAGGIAPWADGFDLLGAAFATLAGGGSSREETRFAIFLWPVVLGVLAVWATVDLTRRLVPREDQWTPLAAGLVAAVIPQFVDISSFGIVDHHIAEALSMLLLAGWCMQRFPVEGERDPGTPWEMAGAAAVALALWLFSGGVLYVALVAVPLGLAALLPERRPARLLGSGAPALILGALAGSLATLPALRAHGRLLSFAVPSMLQPGLVATAGLALGAAALASRRVVGRGPAARAAVALAAAGGVTSLVLALVPSLQQEIRAAIGGWLLRRDPWIDGIAEFQPLLSFGAGEGWGLARVRRYLGPVGLLGAVAVPVGVSVAWRYSRRRAMTFAFLVTVLSGMAIIQLRFARVAGPMLAIGIALALRAVALGISRVPVAGRVARLAPFLGAVAIVLGSAALRGKLTAKKPPEMVSFHRAALELKLDRAPVHGRRDGVLAPWDVGHAMMNLSGRPVVANGFGTYLDPASFREVGDAFLGTEKRLVETMERYDLGYVIGGGFVLHHHQAMPMDEPPVIGNPPGLNPRFMKKMQLSQLLIAGSGLPDAGLPQLERLMPIFASQAVAGNLGFPLPVLWTYELVEGVTLSGRADPGAEVVGELQLTERGRPHRYRAWTTAGAQGAWKMKVAVPSGWSTHTIRTGPTWRITQGAAGAVEVSVPEEAVRQGLQIPVP
jgi:asparagine N-glycosylation enzyme membrane subunit Stt3